MRRLFKRHDLPSTVTLETVDTINATLKRLRARKISGLIYDSDSVEQWNANWIRIYLQAHTRRTLSIIESGMVEISNERPMVAALCARAIFEDAAAIWDFVSRVNGLLDEGDDDATEDFVFARVMATRLPHLLKERGAEFAATNIVTIIDRFSKLNPTYREFYDDLSEVVHPNSLGVVQHFAEFDEGLAIFHDGEKLGDIALGVLIRASYIFCADEPEIEKLENRLTSLRGYA